jgi:hypothetical protein
MTLARDMDDATGTAIADPWARFRTGHWVFVPLIQAGILSIAVARRALAKCDRVKLRQALGLLVEVFTIAPAAFRAAGDLDADAYVTVVRPTMLEAGKDFSGTWMGDHAALLRELRGLFDEADFTAPDFIPLIGRLRLALAATYKAHGVVCTELVGDDAPSLRTAARGNAGAAIDDLRKFLDRALGSIPLPSIPPNWRTP